MCRLDAFMSIILRAKYFPNRNFLAVRLRSNPSYTWKSIMAGRSSLELGLLWKVENGSHINI